ncbi:MAG TPA: hypothetical protein VF585_10805 [Chthoniobacterales bacterium]|jgi:hypothetical protein
MRRVSWLIALLAWAAGLCVWRFAGENALAMRTDRTFHDWLVERNRLPKREPVPVTLVDMEDAENWQALECSLFLKALPKENPPVVILESVPKLGNTAFDRSFTDLAMKQPRLILPAHLKQEKTGDPAALWWLKGWSAQADERQLSSFNAVSDGPPESLLGTVEVGVANISSDNGRTPLYFRVGESNVPSQALRAAMLIRKAAVEKMQAGSGLLLGNQHVRMDERASIEVDTSFVPGMPRLASSDLLLSLESAGAASAIRLEGVVILGNLSETARTVRLENGPTLTPSEWIAATVATLCNGPILTPLGSRGSALIFTGCALGPLLFTGRRAFGRWFGFVALVGLYSLVSLWLAGGYFLAPPLFLPFCVLLLGTAMHHLASTHSPKKS